MLIFPHRQFSTYFSFFSISSDHYLTLFLFCFMLVYKVQS